MKNQLHVVVDSYNFSHNVHLIAEEHFRDMQSQMIIRALYLQRST